MKGNPMTKGSAPTVDREGGVGYLGLVGLVVSSCIGSGVFALTGQLANVASPGAALVAWVLCGLGFLFLALSLANLGARRPDADGAVAYAEEGFGKFAGFVSGWGYWLSAWLGNVGFATMVAQTLGSDYCLGAVLPGVFSSPETGNPALVGVIVVSLALWALTFLVINGDIFTDIDFSVAVRQSETLLSDGLAYLWLTANPPHNPAGDFSLLSDGLIRSEGGGERLTFSGCGLYKSELFAETAPHRAAKLAPLLREAMAAGQVRGHCHNGLWLDVGTPERLNEARCLAASW